MEIPVDNSSASMYLGQITEDPVGNAYRNIGSSLFNQNAVSKEDWKRDEQAATNAFLRDMAQMSVQNQFSSDEAQKQRDFEERMSSTAYQRVVEDMKKSGINPVLAYQQGGSSTPSGASASSSSVSRGVSRGGHYYDDPLTSLLGTVFSFVGGLITGGMTHKNVSTVYKKK